MEKAEPCTWQNLETTLAISAVQSDICSTNIKEENQMKFPSKDIVEKVRAEYPIGTRVELVKMDDVQAPPVDTKGTVKGVDDTASLLVNWDNSSVPVVIWEVTPSDEKALDRYEGYPAFYYKKDIKLQYKGIRTGKRRTINAFAYIMHEDRPIGVPSIYYMKTCLDGYDTFYFDKQILLNAYKNSMEMCENEK